MLLSGTGLNICEKRFVDLIARMALPEQNVNSDESVSWHAHREAETLSDTSVIDELADSLPLESKLPAYPRPRKAPTPAHGFGAVSNSTLTP